jgi:hypothetical protein
MALDPADRANDRKQDFAQGSDKPTPLWYRGQPEKYGGHPMGASAEADSYYENDFRTTAAHKDAYQAVVHHRDTPTGEVTERRYPSVTSGTENGVKGIVAHHPAGAIFIPNSDVAEMRLEEREDAEPAHIRESKYRAQRIRDGFQD